MLALKLRALPCVYLPIEYEGGFTRTALATSGAVKSVQTVDIDAWH